jgi:hypothetical protein
MISKNVTKNKKLAMISKMRSSGEPISLHVIDDAYADSKQNATESCSIFTSRLQMKNGKRNENKNYYPCM